MALLDELFGIRSMQPQPSLDEAPDEILRRALRLNDGPITTGPQPEAAPPLPPVREVRDYPVATAQPTAARAPATPAQPWFGQGELDPAAFAPVVQGASGPPAPAAMPAAAPNSPAGGVSAVPGGVSASDRFGRFLQAGSPGSLARGIGEAFWGADRAAQTENATVRALMTRGGFAPEEAVAIARNPAMMQAVLPRLFGPKPGAVQVAPGGALVDPSTNRVIYRNEMPRPANVPPGWQENPDGTMTWKRGGPADPDYIRSTTEAKDKGKPLSDKAREDFAARGGNIADAARFNRTFEDSFGGGVLLGMGGEAATTWTQNTGLGNKKSAEWWNDYNRYKNKIRNEMFGSALTATEKAAFERADISPNMDPEQIRLNLKRQKEAVESAAKRLAASYLVSNPKMKEAIEAALGVNIEELSDAVADPAPTDGMPKIIGVRKTGQ